jgi:PKD repeat protein
MSACFKTPRLALIVRLLAAMVILMSLARPGGAEERKFLVFLANMPRSFVATGGVPPIPLPSLDRINDVYFRFDPDNELGSFAEYWYEISYGIVRIDGRGLGIVELPWPQYPIRDNTQTGPDDVDDIIEDFSPSTTSDNGDGTGGFFGLNVDADFQFGVGERVREIWALYNTDTYNLFEADEIPGRDPGTDDNVFAAVSEDLDGDDRLDLGIEDLDGDDRFDVAHEDINMNCVLDANLSIDDWFCGDQDGVLEPGEDCNNDNVFEFANEDVDTDGHLDIGENPNNCGDPRCFDDSECPDTWKCLPPLEGRFCVKPCADDSECTAPEVCMVINADPMCPPSEVCAYCATDINRDGVLAATEDIDLDGNWDIINEDSDMDCLPDVADFPHCPEIGPGGPCCPQLVTYQPQAGYVPVWTPGERFRDAFRDEYYDALFEPATNFDLNDNLIVNCLDDQEVMLTDPEDYIETNDNDQRDFPEPLEDFLVMRVTNDTGVSQYAQVSNEYIRNNYGGNVPLLISRIGNNRYDSPDFWDDRSSTDPEATDGGTDPRKLEVDKAGTPYEPFFTTPMPDWFADFWRSRYGVLSPLPRWEVGSALGLPAASGTTPRLIEFSPRNSDGALITSEESVVGTDEVGFTPNKGGTAGWGTVLEQLLHSIPVGGALTFFGMTPDPGNSDPLCLGPDGMPDTADDEGCANARLLNYNCDNPHTYAYPPSEFNGPTDLGPPFTVAVRNDVIFAITEDGTSGCLMPDMAALDGHCNDASSNPGAPCEQDKTCTGGGACDFTSGCDFDQDEVLGCCMTDMMSNITTCTLIDEKMTAEMCEGMGGVVRVEEIGAWSAPTWNLTPFPGQPGGMQDFDNDGVADDWLFNPCDIPNHPDCVNGAAEFVFPFTPGLAFPPTNADCPCVAFDVDEDSNGQPDAESMCCAKPLEGTKCKAPGRYLAEDDDPEDVCANCENEAGEIEVACFIPRCKPEGDEVDDGIPGSPFYPVPVFRLPAELDAFVCLVPFAKRYGNGTMPDDIDYLPEGSDDDPVLPPLTLVYDGPKEYDDLASSLYHTRWRPGNPNDPREAGVAAVLLNYGGDQALGEVTTASFDVADRAIFGHDRAAIGSTGDSHDPDQFIVPAGPLAGGDTAYDTNFDGSFDFGYNSILDPVHGAPGFDGGNVLFLELMTRRTDGSSPTVPLTGPAPPGSGCEGDCGGGFRDFNLDGMIDLGEGRAFGTENYVVDSFNGTLNDGMNPLAYPFNRTRLLEDVIEVMDFIEDFDIWINRDVGCGDFTGVHSIILLPQGLPERTPFAVYSPEPPGQPLNTMDDIQLENLPPNEPQLRVRLTDMLTTTLFTNLGASLDRNGETDIGDEGDEGDGSDVLVAFAAHEFGHFWECWPDLYDYDVFDGGIIERPIGNWDLMAGSSSGLVHVIPVFKEDSGWIRSIDLRTVLSPGLPEIVHLGPVETVSDSYYHYENPDSTCELNTDCNTSIGETCQISTGLCRAPCMDDDDCPGAQVCQPDQRCSGRKTGSRVERFHFFHLQDQGEFSSNLPWDVQSQFECEEGGGNVQPGGMMVLHTDIGANRESRGIQQRLNGHFTYQYEQADGQHSLENSTGNGGDAGDPFPGFCSVSTWGVNTDPDNTWWSSGIAQPADSGIEVLNIDIEPSGVGSAATFLWFPQDIPGLRFLQPPGGQSIGSQYRVIFRWNDINAGTGLSLFAQRVDDQLVIDDQGICKSGCYQGAAQNNSLTVPIPKDTPGSSSREVGVTVGSGGLQDGTYRFYAFLDPMAYSPGVDGVTENSHTEPIFSDPARRGDVDLSVDNVYLNRSDLNSARLEGWTVTHLGSDQWAVCGTLSGLQTDDGSYVTCDEAADYTGGLAVALTGLPFTTVNPPGAVTFTIHNISGDPLHTAPPDSFVFATTGFTAYSPPIEVENGQVDPGPQARITVSSNQPDCPSVCFPGVNVTYDGSESTDSNDSTDGIAAYQWDIGADNPPGAPPDRTGPVIQVPYAAPGEYAVRLTVVEEGTNRTGSFTYTLVVRNRPPVGSFTASPTSGPSPLLVHLNASASSDPDGDLPLRYLWDFDYSASEGFDADLGPTTSPTVDHTFNCASQTGCLFDIALVARDAEGNDGEPAVVRISVGNMRPTAQLTAEPGSGNAPLTVVFDASDSDDVEDDLAELTFVWTFGDGSGVSSSADEQCQTPECSVVKHTYTTTGPRMANVTVTDSNGASASASVLIEVLLGDNNEITADMTAAPASGASPLTVSFTAVALSYRWNFDDGTLGFGTVVSHTYLNTTTSDVVFDPVLIVSDPNGTQATVTRRITVRPPGTPDQPEENPDLIVVFDVMAGEVQEGPAPLTVLFDTRGTRAIGGAVLERIEIDFGDGSTAQQQVPGLVSHTYQAESGGTASYSAQATVFAEDGTFSESQDIDITVFASQAPFPSWAATPRSGTVPLVVSFDASGTFDPEESSDQLEYVWDFGDGVQGAGILTSHTYSREGSFLVTLVVTDSTGASDQRTDDTAIVVSAPPDGGLDDDDDDGQTGDDDDDDGGNGSMCGMMSSTQMLFMLLGLYGLRAGRRRRAL